MASGSVQSLWKPNWRNRSRCQQRSKQVRNDPEGHMWIPVRAWFQSTQGHCCVFRRAGGSEEGHPPPARSLFGLTSPIPSLKSAPEPGCRRLPERTEHLPAGAGRDTPSGMDTLPFVWTHTHQLNIKVF